MLGLTCLFCFPESLFLRLLVSCGMTFILLLLGLCLWCVKKQGQMIRGKLKSANQLKFCREHLFWLLLSYCFIEEMLLI